MIASGAIASSFEIQADDLRDDEAAGVWYFGADGAAATPVGGQLVDGQFTSNRTRTTRVPGAATVRLPVFADADPTEVEILGMEIDMTPDGRGGYDAVVRGGIRRRDVITATHVGVVQLIEARPHDHRMFWSLVDRDRDGVVSRDELEKDDGLIAALLVSDLTLSLGDERVPVLSIAFGVHLSPCAEGPCTPVTQVDRCFDRVMDGDESDIDCGGSCGDCPAAAMCRTGADCQTGGCDGGLCRAPTCSDGMKNGLESGVDCGGSCSGCASFATCEFDFDCASGSCGSNRLCY